ncbi:hypothetical protein, unlikely [Trypanosoma brucei gambiense DAL972]|uniref:Uncharacterized protein n=1 Tax=Trypanosoma brucei gambiense (strain MHOM/CI/86/DAL972) TaxID=679716 RepID=D0A2A5_TRYB9|nr:hypothetical protein, unlikely [Trypanosoma brucei gambiense DAL972]CBH15399.1 hypothetical protein, unlikely [Trypanosoma brucei gambiense DAL972]|eukprot:XP_011777663.1 hypothetical protein, unlikely [Trypanosoma brucei gambiense DAL972]
MNPLPSHPLPLQFVIGSISVSNHHQYLWLPHVYLILSLKIQFVSTPPRFFPLGVFMCTCNCLPFFFLFPFLSPYILYSTTHSLNQLLHFITRPLSKLCFPLFPVYISSTSSSFLMCKQKSNTQIKV